MAKISAYQKRVKERDVARKELIRLQRGVWDLQKAARDGTGEGMGVSPFCDMEGNEEGPRLDESMLRKSILEVRIF